MSDGAPKDLKMFHVKALVEIDMVVLAKDEAEAQFLGERHWGDEMRDAGTTPDDCCVVEVTEASQVAWMGENNLKYSSPYGPRNRTYERGCSAPQQSVAEYLVLLGFL